MPSVSGAVRAFIKTYAELNPDEERMALLDLMDQVSDLEEENRELRRENAELRERLASRKRLERVGGAYFLLEDDGSKTGPVCPQCYEADKIAVILERANGGASCSRCRTRYAGVEAFAEGFKQYIF